MNSREQLPIGDRHNIDGEIKEYTLGSNTKKDKAFTCFNFEPELIDPIVPIILTIISSIIGVVIAIKLFV